MTDEAKQKGQYKTKKQYAEEQRGKNSDREYMDAVMKTVSRTLAELKKTKEFLEQKPEISDALAYAAKLKRTIDRINPTYRFVAVAIFLMAVCACSSSSFMRRVSLWAYISMKRRNSWESRWAPACRFTTTVASPCTCSSYSRNSPTAPLMRMYPFSPSMVKCESP